MQSDSSFVTAGGILVSRTLEPVPYGDATRPVLERLDEQRGVLLGSSYEYPGRYSRYDIGFVAPPLAVEAFGRMTRVTALNARGAVLLPALRTSIAALDAVAAVEDASPLAFAVSLDSVRPGFDEEQRSRQPSVFSVLRGLVALFRSPDPHLGLYGAFGYDLVRQFEPLRLRHPRPAHGRDLVLYLPDEVVVVDHDREEAMRVRYDFTVAGHRTAGLPRNVSVAPRRANASAAAAAAAAPPSPIPGAFAQTVRRAGPHFERGDLFEVTPSYTLREACVVSPVELFQRLRARNPSPFGFLMNLGDDEHLVGASPEMYVRVRGDRVESCPIAGTIARGSDALGDAAQIRRLLDSAKDEAELTMCTDVDRNDKSRICIPGSVRVIGRRQIELYSRLIHTVDHVEGQLRPGFDAIDAFLTHTWAVTVTGAPKIAAMQFIEDEEAEPRRWYGGAVGVLGFDGTLNTGITLRTICLLPGVAEIRVGATLLSDSDPDEEERETLLKASALLDVIRHPAGVEPMVSSRPGLAGAPPTRPPRVLVIDHADSFVHTLANYLRQTGAEVVTRRAGLPLSFLATHAPDLVVLSPGPGRPADFGTSGVIDAALACGSAVFGVCLGLQALVEHFGGRLHVLPRPMHGKPSPVHVRGGRLFQGLPGQFVAGRYHSLYARTAEVPAPLQVTAETEDGIAMAVEHPTLPISAVQFHPESIMTLAGGLGLRLVQNAVPVVTS